MGVHKPVHMLHFVREAWRLLKLTEPIRALKQKRVHQTKKFRKQRDSRGGIKSSWHSVMLYQATKEDAFEVKKELFRKL